MSGADIPSPSGGLYSSISEQFLPSGKLWPKELIENSKDIHFRPKETMRWTSDMHIDDKFIFLNFGASGGVTLSLLDLVGIECTGSFGFLFADRVDRHSKCEVNNFICHIEYGF